MCHHAGYIIGGFDITPQGYGGIVTMITEDQIVLAATEAYLKNKDVSKTTFAVDKLFPALHTAGIRLTKSVENEEDFFKALSNAKNQISRIFGGTQALPLKWKWIWISCLPAEYQHRCIYELNSLGLETVPSKLGAHAMADIGLLAKESGEAITATAVIAGDGKYDHNDSPEDIQKALNELYDLRDAAQAHIDAIERDTGQRVKRSVRFTYTKEVKETLTIT